MTFIFECDRRFNSKPGICKSDIMTRIWWLWFAVGIIHIPFEEFSSSAYVWNDPTSIESQIFNSPVTFSVNCRSGFVPHIIPRCECFRCRADRGQPPDEALAVEVAALADQKWSAIRQLRENL